MTMKKRKLKYDPDAKCIFDNLHEIYVMTIGGFGVGAEKQKAGKALIKEMVRRFNVHEDLLDAAKMACDKSGERQQLKNAEHKKLWDAIKKAERK